MEIRVLYKNLIFCGNFSILQKKIKMQMQRKFLYIFFVNSENLSIFGKIQFCENFVFYKKYLKQ